VILIPVVGLIWIFLLAFDEWPIERELMQLGGGRRRRAGGQIDAEGRIPEQARPFSQREFDRLVQELRDERVHVRWDAVKHLGALGEKAREALPVLRELLQDRDGMIRQATEDAIRAVEAEQSPKK
jgi:hypothetical protein